MWVRVPLRVFFTGIMNPSDKRKSEYRKMKAAVTDLGWSVPTVVGSLSWGHRRICCE